MIFNQKTPLTSEQIKIWLAQKLYPGISEFQLAYIVVIDTIVDVGHFQQAFMHLVRQNDALHSRLIVENSTPYLITVPDQIEPLAVLDMSDGADVFANFEEWARNRATNTCFTTDNAMLDSVLVKLSPNQYGWYLCLNHIISDDYSLTLILQQFDKYYQASLNKKLSLVAPNISYHQHMIQQNTINEVVAETDKGEVKTPITLFGKQHQQNLIESERVQITLTSKQSHHLAELLYSEEIFYRSKNITVANVLFAAFTSFIGRNTGLDLLDIGFVSHQRQDDIAKQTIGFFSRILPITLQIKPHVSFIQWVKIVNHALTVHVKKRTNTSFSTKSSTDIIFNYKPYQFNMFAGAPISVKSLDTTQQIKILALNAFDFDATGNLILAFDCVLDVFSEVKPQYFIENFMAYLDAILKNPEQKIYQIPLMSDRAYHDILEASAGANKPLPEENLTFITAFAELVRCTPDAVAVRDEKQQLTYLELDKMSNQLAHFLVDKGIKAETVVAVLMPHCIEILVTILAILKAGGTYLPLDESYPTQRLEFMLIDSSAILLLTKEATELPPSIHQTTDVLFIDSDTHIHQIKQYTRVSLEYTPKISQIAYIIYTSGSTGQPKGVVIEHQQLMHYLQWCLEQYFTTPPATVPLFTSLAFDLTITSLFGTLLAGHTLWLISSITFIDWVDALRHDDNPISLLKLTPSHLEILNQVQGFDTIAKRISTLIVGGEALYATHVTPLLEINPDITVINEYGPTEATVGCCVYIIKHHQPIIGHIPIGKPIDRTQMYILDVNLELVPIGVKGDLYIGGSGVSRGYLNRREQMSKQFINNPFKDGRLYKTGDIARYLPDGNLEFLGRSDNQIKRLGYRIELDEIEQVLNLQPDISQAVVLFNDQETNDPQLTAYYVTASTISSHDLRALLADVLPEPMLPNYLIEVDEFPLTPNGKINRQQLAGIRPVKDQIQEEVQTDYERLLVKVWQEVLGVDSIGSQSHFFSSGGDSLKALRLISLLKQVYNARLTLRIVFNYPVLSHMAEQLIVDNSSSVLDEEDFLKNLSESELDLLLRANLDIDNEE